MKQYEISYLEIVNQYHATNRCKEATTLTSAKKMVANLAKIGVDASIYDRKNHCFIK